MSAKERDRLKVLCLLTGCAVKHPPASYRALHSIQFRNCQITEQRDGRNSCECPQIEWIRDAKAGRWIAVCLKETQIREHPTPPSTWIDPPAASGEESDDE